MAGIPKRRSGERGSSYRLRCLDAETTRRDNKKIAQVENELSEMRKRHEKEYEDLFAELVRCYRAKPGTKYDITARKNK
jgi:hypothetical protein